MTERFKPLYSPEDAETPGEINAVAACESIRRWFHGELHVNDGDFGAIISAMLGLFTNLHWHSIEAGRPDHIPSLLRDYVVHLESGRAPDIHRPKGRG